MIRSLVKVLTLRIRKRDYSEMNKLVKSRKAKSWISLVRSKYHRQQLSKKRGGDFRAGANQGAAEVKRVFYEGESARAFFLLAHRLSKIV